MRDVTGYERKKLDPGDGSFEGKGGSSEMLASVGTALFRLSIIALYGSLALLVTRHAIRNR